MAHRTIIVSHTGHRFSGCPFELLKNKYITLETFIFTTRVFQQLLFLWMLDELLLNIALNMIMPKVHGSKYKYLKIDFTHFSNFIKT